MKKLLLPAMFITFLLAGCNEDSEPGEAKSTSQSESGLCDRHTLKNCDEVQKKLFKMVEPKAK